MSEWRKLVLHRQSAGARSTRSHAPASLTTTALRGSVRAHLPSGGAGDLLIADELERRGVTSTAIRDALAVLEPEVQRAGRIVAQRGTGARTGRYLAQKGFHEETIGALIAEPASDGIE